MNLELEAVRKNQTARDKEELEIGVSCMAAAIYDDAHQVIAGLSISAPANQLQESWLELLRNAAKEISQAMGDMTE